REGTYQELLGHHARSCKHLNAQQYLVDQPHALSISPRSSHRARRRGARLPSTSSVGAAGKAPTTSSHRAPRSGSGGGGGSGGIGSGGIGSGGTTDGGSSPPSQLPTKRKRVPTPPEQSAPGVSGSAGAAAASAGYRGGRVSGGFGEVPPPGRMRRTDLLSEPPGAAIAGSSSPAAAAGGRTSVAAGAGVGSGEEEEEEERRAVAAGCRMGWPPRPGRVAAARTTPPGDHR
ncbi:unnamed protein product, partial [Scytosiphon promiscuus]